MSLIGDDVRKQLVTEFEGLASDVRLAVFSQTLADPVSEQVKRLVEELAELHPRLSLESYNFVLDKEKVESLGIVRIPAIAILGADKDYGIRMYGVPGGYEFGTLVDTILDVGSGASGLSEPTRETLAELARPVHIQVFATPT